MRRPPWAYPAARLRPWYSIDRFALLVLVRWASACGDPAADRPAAYANVRDSAGIQIVENGPLASVDTLGIVVDSAARVRIGLVDGDAPYVFSRIVGATRLEDGRVAIADQRAAEVRFFDGEGRFLSAVGGRGSGPGEYINFYRAFRMPADSLLIVDHEGGRWHFADTRGMEAQTQRPTAYTSVRTSSTQRHRVETTYADGALLVREPLTDCLSRAMVAAGVCTDSLRLMRISRNGEVLADFGAVAGQQAYRARMASGVFSVVLEFYGQGAWAVAGTRTYIGTGDVLELRRFGPTGALEQIIRVDEVPVPTSAGFDPTAVPDSLFEDEEARGRHAEWRAVALEAPKPADHPIFEALVADATGSIWVRLTRATGAALGHGLRWAVIDSTGTLRHVVRTPPLMLPAFLQAGSGIEIGKDYLMAPGIGDYQVPVVDLYPLARHDDG